MAQNFLYYGDNLDILRRYINDETVDLVYLDPPFKSNQNYNVLFQERNGSRSKAQIKVFKDTWQWGKEAAEAYQKIIETGPEKVSKVMQAFRIFLGDNDMLAYLSMMAPRLVELRRVLKPTGSIYLHCDPTASAHLRLLMDAVFGPNNFRNEIVWHYDIGGKPKYDFRRKHDIILRYSKTGVVIWNEIRLAPLNPKRYNKIDKNGRRYYEGYGGKWRKYLDDGTPADDVWTFIREPEFRTLNSQAKERLGYPTQKPEALLERIIKASSRKGDVVLDPFCGCGTAIAVAQRLNRQWIGIDITHLAITLIKHRLQDTFGGKVVRNGKVQPGIEYEVIGEPVSLPDAETLAHEDPYQFQWWALGLVGARPVEQKKGADKGIDGRLYFHDEGLKAKTKQIILQVKGGHINSANIRDLRGVLDREKAEIGVFITLQKPSKSMMAEAAGAGFYYSPGWQKHYPRLQILTIEELLNGKTINYPAPKSTNITFKKAPRFKKGQSIQGELFDND